MIMFSISELESSYILKAARLFFLFETNKHIQMSSK